MSWLSLTIVKRRPNTHTNSPSSSKKLLKNDRTLVMHVLVAPAILPLFHLLYFCFFGP